jgi:lysophospholipase L1-like esterase
VPRYGDIVYAALGDSISIDEYAGGPGRGAASLLARNHDEDFPHWRGRDLATRYPALDYHLLAVDGGTTGTLLNSQLPRLGASGLRPAVVTLTVGGNDLLAAYGDTPQARAVVRTVIVRVGQALTRLARLMRSPDDPIILGTVYDPSDGSADAARLGLPPWPDVRDVLTELNDGLRAVTAQHRALPRFMTGFSAMGSPSAIRPNRILAPRTAPSGTATSSSRTPGEPAPCERASGRPSSNRLTTPPAEALNVLVDRFGHSLGRCAAYKAARQRWHQRSPVSVWSRLSITPSAVVLADRPSFAS